MRGFFHFRFRFIPLLSFPHTSVVLALCLFSFCFIPLLSDAKLDTIPVDDLKEGLKGYGLTVFKGTTPERFEVELVGIMKNAMPQHDFIIVKCTDPRVIQKGVAQGMSGSPIYFQNKLAGALSRTFGFAKEPYALVTPIANMLEEGGRPQENAGVWPPSKDDPYRPIDTPLFISGLTGSARAYLAGALEPYGFKFLEGGQAGGIPPQPKEAEKFSPGSGIGVILVRGDWSAAGIGTVTAVDGDKVYAFGHPMFLSGEMAIPISTTYIFDIFPSLEVSFKLGAPLQEAGMLLQDRLPCIVGTTARKAPMIPMAVTIQNPNTKFKKSFSFEIAKHQTLTARLLIAALFQLLQQTESTDTTPSAITYKLTLHLKGHEPLIIEDVYAQDPQMIPGPGAAMGQLPEQFQMIQHVLTILNNPFKKVDLERIQAEFSVLHEKRGAPIDLAWLSSGEVQAGDTLTVHLQLRPNHQDPVHDTVELAVPKTLPEGDYEIHLSGGREASADLSKPETLDDLFLFYKHIRLPANVIVAKLLLPSVGLIGKGTRTPSLPSSVVGTLIGGGAAAGLDLERDYLNATKSVNWIVGGKKRLTVKVVKKKGG